MKFLLSTGFTAFLILFLSSCETTTGGSGGGETSASPAENSVRPYPLSTCLVTGEDLNAKGGPITQVYQGQEVKVCCKPCQMAFKKNPDLYLAKLQ